MYRTHKRPSGRPTRGKTAPGRLRRLDRLLVRLDEGLIRRTDGVWRDAAFVDVGFGATPTTTLEAAALFRRLNHDLLVIGVEIDPERVAAAAHAEDARTRFRRGGFDFPLLAGESARLIRAMNVLRQYPEEAVADAHREMLDRLVPGGLLIEGTSSEAGDLTVVHRIRTGPAAERTVLFSVDLRHPPVDGPRALQARLPKSLIHRVVPGEPIAGLMDAWDLCWRQARPAAVFGPRAHWIAGARALMASHPEVVRRPSLLRAGALIWRPPDPTR